MLFYNDKIDLHAYDPYERLRPLPSFSLESTDFTHNGPLAPAQYGSGAGGSDISPQLSWSDFPEDTVSFAVTCYDPDAPTGSGWWHWAVFNIPASVTSLEAGAGNLNKNLLPNGAITLKNTSGKRGFNGAGAPEGTGVHRYIFAVHSLPKMLDLGPDTDIPILGFNLNFQATGRALLTGTAYYGGVADAED